MKSGGFGVTFLNISLLFYYTKIYPTRKAYGLGAYTESNKISDWGRNREG